MYTIWCLSFPPLILEVHSISALECRAALSLSVLLNVLSKFLFWTFLECLRLNSRSKIFSIESNSVGLCGLLILGVGLHRKFRWQENKSAKLWSWTSFLASLKLLLVQMRLLLFLNENPVIFSLLGLRLSPSPRCLCSGLGHVYLHKALLLSCYVGTGLCSPSERPWNVSVQQHWFTPSMAQLTMVLLTPGAERKKAAGLASFWPLEGKKCLLKCFQSFVWIQNWAVEPVPPKERLQHLWLLRAPRHWEQCRRQNLAPLLLPFAGRVFPQGCCSL